MEWNYRVSTRYTSSIPLRTLITRTMLKGRSNHQKTVTGITCVGVGGIGADDPDGKAWGSSCSNAGHKPWPIVVLGGTQ